MKLSELHFYEYTPTFKHKIQTPKITMNVRKTLFIGLIDESGTEWFGECNAFETDWYHYETIETVKRTLESWFKCVEGHEIHDFSEAQRMADKLNDTPAARATVMMALYQMFHDLPSFEVPMTVTVNGDMQKRFLRIDHAERIKIKWNCDIVEQVKLLTAMYPDIPITTDANQTLSDRDIPLLNQLANYNLAYIEEPFPELLKEKELGNMPPIAIDEHATDEQAIVQAVQCNHVRVIVIKPFRVGGIDRALSLIDTLHNQGITVVIGGMYECGLSRYFTALASRYGDYAGDVTPCGYYFTDDIVEQSGQIIKGRLRFKPPVIDMSKLQRYL
ncbi:o-succinylbenzoate synthase [Staphylococcus muscae]|uniref:o-succinylbenzoate synthase n=1 Tax=Staphylococcus muscae TaxID=1294 RepID=A0A240C535_9STAP|nr:o-succinylbenzoate synthase [Staphylococcus muscae]AVQ33329.1 o-succinylbenzoate synthase [Staphylococcus muscae]PNZ01915.1 o-succinylbenzoate synthase [Staphylococcus muscae]GGA94534.1 o-succinylbenzoate synthase [Staphylococcus muscae]SNW03025.1 O-succinylbenzoic acid (OSB) synthetase [Staphylococcus muscae]